MKKSILKIFVLLIFISIFINTFTLHVEAFLEGDLGLNMYNDLDNGLKDFETKMYVYELSEQDKQDISTSVNKILSNKGIGGCLIKGVNTNIIQSIVEGDVKILLDNMKEECYNPEKKEYSNKKISDIVSEIGNIKNYYLNKANQKAKSIHEVSRIGMYSDGNVDNSPFDLIKDINDINAILFTDKIEYESEDLNFFNKYENKLLLGPFGNYIGNSNSNQNNTEKKLNTDLNNTDNSLNNTNNNGEEIYNGKNNKGNPDSNIYACTNNNDSGLNSNSIDILIGGINGGNSGNGEIINYGAGGNIRLPKTNAITIPTNLLLDNFNSQLVKNGISPYKEITDKNVWECNDFFCITIDFIVRNQRALDYGVSHSIQNIIETSNKHLKKAANTSLVQSKMTTNNFEISLRDLNLPDIFHMGINLSYKSPPILNLDKLPGDTIKQMLIQKYKNFGLNYNAPNNLNKFNQKLRKIKGLYLTTENPANRGLVLNYHLNKVLKLKSEILDYNKNVLHKKINNDILKNFEIQFKEITQFNINIMNYVHNLDTLVKNLKDIPIFTG